jgi:hypothetical protein
VSALEPGLYRWSFGGKSYDGIMDCDGDFSYLSSDGRHCTRGHGYTTDARPLIVLDLTEDDARHLVSYLEITVERHPDQLGTVGRAVYTNVAAQVAQQTKPARIPEPGLWGVVQADRRRYIRYSTDDCGEVWSSLLGQTVTWDSLIDPTLIREGVTS